MKPEPIKRAGSQEYVALLDALQLVAPPMPGYGLQGVFALGVWVANDGQTMVYALAGPEESSPEIRTIVRRFLDESEP